MFYAKQFSIIRLLQYELLEDPASLEINFFNNIFVFEETTGNIQGLHEQVYDSQVSEESIKGKDVTVEYWKGRVDSFVKELVENFSNVLQFKLNRIGVDELEDLEEDFEKQHFDFLEHFYGEDQDMPSLNPVLSSNYHIFSHKPRTEFSSSYFINVFDSHVWYAIAGIIFTSCVMFAIFKYFLKKSDVDYIEAIYFTLGLADVRDSDRMSTSLRVTCAVLSFYIFLLMAAFSTFLTSELAAKDSEVPFHNLDEFRLQHEYGFCVPEYFVWLLGDLGYSQTLNGNNCPEIYPPPPISELLENVCNYDKSVFLIPDVNVYNALNTVYHGFPPCNIYKFADDFRPLYSTIQTKPGFKYKRQIGLIITKHRTSGCLMRMDRTQNGNKEMHLNYRNDSELTSIEFDHVILIYIIYFVMIITSWTAFMCEWLIYKFRPFVRTETVLPVKIKVTTQLT